VIAVSLRGQAWDPAPTRARPGCARCSRSRPFPCWSRGPIVFTPEARGHW